MNVHSRVLGQLGERQPDVHLTRQGGRVLAHDDRSQRRKVVLIVERSGERVAGETQTREVRDREQPDEMVHT